MLLAEVVAHLKHSSLRLQVVKDLGVHLSLHLVGLLEDGI